MNNNDTVSRAAGEKIIPHLWFDTQAKEAAEWYVNLFPNSKITHSSTLHNTPSGDTDVLSFELAGQPFMAISAGPVFKFNPSVSFFVNFDPSRDEHAEENLDKLWEQLSTGGKVLMELQEYPFSKRYGWVEDKFGVSWQLILTSPQGEQRPVIIPSLMFTKAVFGKAEEATDFYISIFPNSKRGAIAHYPAGMNPDTEGAVMFTDFALHGQWFAAMDGAGTHDFAFNEAISFVVPCKDQAEIDYYWEKLSHNPQAEQCGWCKDQYGVSWQIVPTRMNEMMSQGTPEQIARVTQTFLKMKKFIVSDLEKAYAGE